MTAKIGRKPVTEHFVAADKVERFVPAIDPFNMRERLQRETSRLLERMEDTPTEDIEIKTWYMTLIAMWRMEAVGVTLRKEKFDEPNRGSSVRKYATAFTQANDASGRKKIARGNGKLALPEPEPEPEPEPDEPDIEAILNGDDDGDHP